MRTAIIAACVALMPSIASADLEQVFATDSIGAGTTLVDNVFTRTLTGLTCDDVTFDATLTATGAGSLFGTGNLTVGAAGLGVDGPTIDNGESVTFSMSISNVTPSPTGRSITFTGFSSADFNGLQVTEGASFSSDEVGPSLVAGGTDEFTFGNSASFTIVASPGSDFNLADVTANFASVPEPSSLALAFGLCPLVMGRRRRK